MSPLTGYTCPNNNGTQRNSLKIESDYRRVLEEKIVDHALYSYLKIVIVQNNRSYRGAVFFTTIPFSRQQFLLECNLSDLSILKNAYVVVTQLNELEYRRRGVQTCFYVALHVIFVIY